MKWAGFLVIFLHVVFADGTASFLDLSGMWQITPVPCDDWELATDPATDAIWEMVYLPNVHWYRDTTSNVQKFKDEYPANKLENYVGIWSKEEFHLTGEDVKRPIQNDELLCAFGDRVSKQWLGIDNRADDLTEKQKDEIELYKAERGGMRQTEICRRLGFNGILYYMVRAGANPGNHMYILP